MTYPQRANLALRRIAITSGARLGLLLTASLVLAGCAMQPLSSAGTSSVMADGGQGRALDANLNGFLSQSSPGAVLTLASSPWGNDVEVVADAPYYAASGRTCRQLSIAHQQRNNTRDVVACETADGWVAQRLVTRAQGGELSQ